MIVLTMMLGLAACSGGTNPSGEKGGVPQKQLEAEIYPQGTTKEYTVTSCTHDVDTSLHQDTVTIKYRKNAKYMQTDYVQTYIYQYDRSKDTWTKKSESRRNYNYTLSNSLKNTRWKGTEQLALGGTLYYDITVDAINTIDGWIKLSYYIYFAKKEYRGTAYMQYGEFTLTQVEGLFRISFNSNEGISASRY